VLVLRVYDPAITHRFHSKNGRMSFQTYRFGMTLTMTLLLLSRAHSVALMEVRYARMAFDIIAALLGPLQALFGGLKPLVFTIGPLTLLVFPLLLFV
jgi:hypothetical protein